MNVVREIERLNNLELSSSVPLSASWHAPYLESKTNQYIFISGLHPDLTEGDVLIVFSQCGELIDCNLVRDRNTGKSRGFAFVAYANPLSTVLAIDNFNGVKLLDRVLRVDHADKYKRPKSSKELEFHHNKRLRDEDFMEFSLEEDQKYEQRKKLIWDYERWGRTENKIQWNKLNDEELLRAARDEGEKVHSFSSSDLSANLIKEEAKHDQRIQRIMEKMAAQVKAMEEEEREIKSNGKNQINSELLNKKRLREERQKRSAETVESQIPEHSLTSSSSEEEEKKKKKKHKKHKKHKKEKKQKKNNNQS
jgi:RNA-binding motif X-linked protein 2